MALRNCIAELEQRVRIIEEHLDFSNDESSSNGSVSTSESLTESEHDPNAGVDTNANTESHQADLEVTDRIHPSAERDEEWKTEMDGIINWFRGMEFAIGRWLLARVGALSIIIAMAYLFQYSIEQGLITPVVRLSISAAFGVVCLLMGEYYHRVPSTMSVLGKFGAAFTGIGIAVLILASYGGHILLKLFSWQVSLSCVAVVSILGVIQSLRHSFQLAALLIGFGGFLGPLIIRVPPPPPVDPVKPLTPIQWAVREVMSLVTAAMEEWSAAEPPTPPDRPEYEFQPLAVLGMLLLLVSSLVLIRMRKPRWIGVAFVCWIGTPMASSIVIRQVSLIQQLVFICITNALFTLSVYLDSRQINAACDEGKENGWRHLITAAQKILICFGTVYYSSVSFDDHKASPLFFAVFVAGFAVVHLMTYTCGESAVDLNLSFVLVLHATAVWRFDSYYVHTLLLSVDKWTLLIIALFYASTWREALDMRGSHSDEAEEYLGNRLIPNMVIVAVVWCSFPTKPISELVEWMVVALVWLVLPVFKQHRKITLLHSTLVASLFLVNLDLRSYISTNIYQMATQQLLALLVALLPFKRCGVLAAGVSAISAAKYLIYRIVNHACFTMYWWADELPSTCTFRDAVTDTTGWVWPFSEAFTLMLLVTVVIGMWAAVYRNKRGLLISFAALVVNVVVEEMEMRKDEPGSIIMYIALLLYTVQPEWAFIQIGGWMILCVSAYWTLPWSPSLSDSFIPFINTRVACGVAALLTSTSIIRLKPSSRIWKWTEIFEWRGVINWINVGLTALLILGEMVSIVSRRVGIYPLKIIYLDLNLCHLEHVYSATTGSHSGMKWRCPTEDTYAPYAQMAYLIGLALLARAVASRQKSGTGSMVLKLVVHFYTMATLAVVVIFAAAIDDVCKFAPFLILDYSMVAKYQRPHLILSLAISLYGSLCVAYGMVRSSALSRWVGMCVLFGAATKVVLFDLSHLHHLWRVGSFAALGATFMLGSYIYHLGTDHGKDRD